MAVKKNKDQELDVPQMHLFEGIEGIKKIYKQTLIDKEPIFALTAVVPGINKELVKWLNEEYVKERIKNKIFVKGISPKTKEAEKFAKNDPDCYRKTLLIPKDKFPISIEINIFGDKVSLVSFKKKELIGIIIESKEVANTMRVFFDLSWERAMDYQKDWEKRI